MNEEEHRRPIRDRTEGKQATPPAMPPGQKPNEIEPVLGRTQADEDMRFDGVTRSASALTVNQCQPPRFRPAATVNELVRSGDDKTAIRWPGGGHQSIPSNWGISKQRGPIDHVPEDSALRDRANTGCSVSVVPVNQATRKRRIASSKLILIASSTNGRVGFGSRFSLRQ